MSVHLPLGPVIVDVAGLVLDDTDRRRLCHPLVGGIILFARNFESPAQVKALTTEIRALRTQELVICVDHEGGRVQRFREGFTRIPPMRTLGELWNRDPAAAVRAAESTGLVIGAELGAHGVDLSFTPVLDLDYGARSLEEIIALDVAPYRPTIAAGLAGIMPAHVVYEAVAPDPAGFSPFWLKEVLRKQLGFDGVIFSDDLSMEGASTAGGMKERALAAFAAGCDSVLVCNAPQAADELLAALSGLSFPSERLERIRHDARRAIALDAEAYRAALKDVAALA